MGHRAAAWRVAFAFLVTMLSTTLPTPLYPLYQSRFDLTALTVTGLYALYAVGVIMALLLFGAWSDRFGRLRMVRAGLLLSGLSAVAFVAAVRLPAGGLAALLTGRVLSGLSVGFVAGAATAALVDLAGPGRQRRASLVAAAVNTGGLAAGPLLAGALAQYWREPLQSAFAVDLALVAIAILGLIGVPEPAAVRGGRPRLQRLGVPAPVRGAFFRVGLAGFASFAVLGLFAAVSAAFLTQVMHERNHALVGGVACLAFVTSTIGQLLSAAVSERRSLLIGSLGLAAGAGLVAESLIHASLPLLVAAATVSGLSHGMVFRAGLTVVTAASPSAHRAEVTSSFFVTLYIGISIPVVGLGAGADRYGLLRAGTAFAALAGLLALLAFLTVLPRRSLLPRGDPERSRPQSTGPEADAVAPAPITVAWYPATDTGGVAGTAANATAAAATLAVEAAAAANAAATAAATAMSAAAAAANAASEAANAASEAANAASAALAAVHAAATATPASPSRAPAAAAPSAPAAVNPTVPTPGCSDPLAAGPAAPPHSRPHFEALIPAPQAPATTRPAAALRAPITPSPCTTAPAAWNPSATGRSVTPAIEARAVPSTTAPPVVAAPASAPSTVTPAVTAPVHAAPGTVAAPGPQPPATESSMVEVLAGEPAQPNGSAVETSTEDRRAATEPVPRAGVVEATGVGVAEDKAGGTDAGTGVPADPRPMCSTDRSAGEEPAEAAPGAGGPAPNPDGWESSLGATEVDPDVTADIGAADRPWHLIAAAAVALTVLVGGGVAFGAVLHGRPETTASLPPVMSSVPPLLSSPSPLSSPSASPATTPPVPVSADHPAVQASINVGTEPEGVAVAPDSRTVYVANQHSHVLSVIDVASRNVSSVGLAHTPRFVAVSHDGAQMYASTYEDDLSGSGVAIVDVATTSVRYLDTGPQPYALSVAPDGNLWVPIHSQHRIEVYDPNTGARVAVVQIPPNAHSVTFSPTLARAYTPDHESNLVSAIDMHTNRSTGIPVDTAPHSLALSPDQRTIIVACYGANVVDFIDPVSLRNTGRLRVGVKPRYVTFSTDGSHAYVVNEGSNSVSVIDVASRTVSSVIPVGHSPRTIAVAPDGRLAYVSNGRDNTISVLGVAR